MEYKFGVSYDKQHARYRVNYVKICNCGQGVLRHAFQCDKCGNRYFVDIKKRNGRFTIPYLGLIYKNNRGFKIRRTNLSITFENFTVTPIKENMVRTLEYDMVDGTLKVWKNDHLEFDSEIHNIYSLKEVDKLFFNQLDQDAFLDFISTDVTRDLYTDCVKRLSENKGNSWNSDRKYIFTGLKKLAEQDYQYLQILSNAGVTKVGRFLRTNYYGRRVNQSGINVLKTKPHEILKVPKFMMDYIRQDESIDFNTLSNLQEAITRVDANKFRQIMSIVKDEGDIHTLARCVGDMMQLHIDYGYTNLKQLVLYLFRETRLMQGIQSATDSTTYLKDYVRMSRRLNLEWEKYPKSLKKVHDVTLMNYKLIVDDKNNDKLDFLEKISLPTYKELVYGLEEKIKDDFVIIAPESPDDLVKEGNQLSHCVASYVKDVIRGKCKIYFLRNKGEDMDKPLVTIEIRGMNIRQAKGKSNRPVTPEQKEFITKWAREKDLIEDYY